MIYNIKYLSEKESERYQQSDKFQPYYDLCYPFKVSELIQGEIGILGDDRIIIKEKRRFVDDDNLDKHNEIKKEDLLTTQMGLTKENYHKSWADGLIFKALDTEIILGNKDKARVLLGDIMERYLDKQKVLDKCISVFIEFIDRECEECEGYEGAGKYKSEEFKKQLKKELGL